MTTWDHLLKQMLWQQLDFVQGMKILDFGSGAAHPGGLHAAAGRH